MSFASVLRKLHICHSRGWLSDDIKLFVTKEVASPFVDDDTLHRVTILLEGVMQHYAPVEAAQLSATQAGVEEEKKEETKTLLEPEGGFQMNTRLEHLPVKTIKVIQIREWSEVKVLKWFSSLGMSSYSWTNLRESLETLQPSLSGPNLHFLVTNWASPDSKAYRAQWEMPKRQKDQEILKRGFADLAKGHSPLQMSPLKHYLTAYRALSLMTLKHRALIEKLIDSNHYEYASQCLRPLLTGMLTAKHLNRLAQMGTIPEDILMFIDDDVFGSWARNMATQLMIAEMDTVVKVIGHDAPQTFFPLLKDALCLQLENCFASKFNVAQLLEDEVIIKGPKRKLRTKRKFQKRKRSNERPLFDLVKWMPVVRAARALKNKSTERPCSNFFLGLPDVVNWKILSFLGSCTKGGSIMLTPYYLRTLCGFSRISLALRRMVWQRSQWKYLNVLLDDSILAGCAKQALKRWGLLEFIERVQPGRLLFHTHSFPEAYRTVLNKVGRPVGFRMGIRWHNAMRISPRCISGGYSCGVTFDVGGPTVDQWSLRLKNHNENSTCAFSLGVIDDNTQITSESCNDRGFVRIAQNHGFVINERGKLYGTGGIAQLKLLQPRQLIPKLADTPARALWLTLFRDKNILGLELTHVNCKTDNPVSTTHVLSRQLQRGIHFVPALFTFGGGGGQFTVGNWEDDLGDAAKYF